MDKKRQNHKYIVRVETGKKFPKYKYFYDKEEYRAYLKSNKMTVKSDPKSEQPNLLPKMKLSTKELVDNGKQSIDNLLNKTFDNIKKSAENTVNKGIETTEKILTESPKFFNKVIAKVYEVGNKIYDDPNNMYDVNPSNYDKKIEKIKQSDEWKEIVKSGNPEYVKKNSDGSTNYLIDDYLIKKKRPLLDAVDDIVNQRPITLNKVEKDAVVAGLKQQVFGKITLGMIAVGAVSKVLTEAGKVSQGSYTDQINDLYTSIDNGKEYVETFTKTPSTVTEEDVRRMAELITKTREVTNVEKAAKKLSEDDIITAAKVIMQNDNIPTNVSENEYYKKAENALTNLSEEEIIMLNILLNNLRKQ